MASFPVVSSVTGLNIHFASEGDGSTGDPLAPHRSIRLGTDLVSAANPFPVTIAGSTSGVQFFEETQLTAPGATTGRNVAGATMLQFLITAIGIAGGSATVVGEVSHNGSAWFPLTEPYVLSPSTVDSNSRDTISYGLLMPLSWVRFRLISVTGDPFLDVVTVVK
jgi:hypothetical protein